jgi:hypothetical protein
LPEDQALIIEAFTVVPSLQLDSGAAVALPVGRCTLR